MKHNGRKKSCEYALLTFTALSASIQLFLQCLKRLVQILDDVVDVLRTDGETDRVLLDALVR